MTASRRSARISSNVSRLHEVAAATVREAHLCCKREARATDGRRRQFVRVRCGEAHYPSSLCAETARATREHDGPSTAAKRGAQRVTACYTKWRRYLSVCPGSRRLIPARPLDNKAAKTPVLKLAATDEFPFPRISFTVNRRQPCPFENPTHKTTNDVTRRFAYTSRHFV